MLSFLSPRWSVLLLVLLLSAGCSKTPLRGEELKYVGYWKSYNGSVVEILANGGGNCQKFSFDGTFNSRKKMRGAQVVVQDSVLRFVQLGLSTDFRVDEAPTLRAGRMHLKLDGMDYVKLN